MWDAGGDEGSVDHPLHQQSFERERRALFQKIVEAEDERARLLQQLRELWEESAQESGVASGSSSSQQEAVSNPGKR